MKKNYLVLTQKTVIMEPQNRILGRAMFVFVWLTIGIISTAIAVTFVIGLKTIFGI